MQNRVSIYVLHFIQLVEESPPSLDVEFVNGRYFDGQFFFELIVGQVMMPLRYA